MEFLPDYIMELLFAVITAIAGIAYAMLKKYMKKKWQIDIGDFLNNSEIEKAVYTEIKRVKKKFGDKLEDHEFENEVVENALNFIDEQFPNWVKEYGYTPETLEKYIRNKYAEATE